MPVGARFSRPAPGAQPASRTMGTGSFPGVKSVPGMALTPHPLLVPWSWMSRAIPLLPLWAVRPVQSLSACTKVHFTFTFYHNDRNETRCIEFHSRLGRTPASYLLFLGVWSGPWDRLTGYAGLVFTWFCQSQISEYVCNWNTIAVFFVFPNSCFTGILPFHAV